MYAGRGSTNSEAVGGVAYANGFALKACRGWGNERIFGPVRYRDAQPDRKSIARV
jgi:hypothetical protein